MPNVPLLNLDEIQDKELRGLIRQAEERGAPDPNYFRMMGHAPELAKGFYKVWVESFNGGKVDHKLKEVIRVMMSRYVDCSY
ncbi:MAG: hypothetical protein ACE5JS_09040 [Nitrospinota bacterium]